MKITLVIPHLNRGGAARSMLALAHAVGAFSSVPIHFTVLVLGNTDPAAVAVAHENGFVIQSGRQTDQALALLRQSDLVHVQFWNTPEMYAWLHAALPPMRLVVTLDVTGEFPAQCVLPELLDLADWVVPTTAYSLKLPVFQKLDAGRRARVRVILPGTKFPDPVDTCAIHDGLRVGYAGAVDFCKLHPRFIELCAAVKDPQVRFPIVGGGDAVKTLDRQAAALGIAGKVEWHGYREDYLNAVKTFDVFGYPLCRETYATSDLVLQDAMRLGVPPVILDHGALPLLIQDGITGILAKDEAEYVRAVQRLGNDPAQRADLAENTRAYARQYFGADKSGIELSALYEEVLEHGKGEHEWGGTQVAPEFPGASALCESFGDAASPYITSLMSDDPSALDAAENRIAYANPVEINAAGGGILDYRRAFPRDPFLCLWSGLVLGQQGRFALAAAQFQASRQTGLDTNRTLRYFERVSQHRKPFEDEPTHG